ncbi:MAG: TadE family protein [Candidatus Gastranaerophilaceae bacterium]
MKRKSQNLIEFIFVFPLVVFLVMAIFELAMFYRTVHAVQSVAFQAAAKAATQIIKNDMTSTSIGDPSFNVAIQSALDTVIAKKGALGTLDFDTFQIKTYSDFGSPPYTLYELTSDRTINTTTGAEPLVTLWVDCSDPMEKGIKVQLKYYYVTIIFAAEVPLPDGRKMTILPKDIAISSTKIQQYNQL